MKITISGSLGNVGKPLTKHLVAADHQVTVISSNKERKAAIEALGATAAIGSVRDEDFLTNALKGADAVFAMTPPAMGPNNILANTINAGKAYASAIKKAGTPRVVMLSSVGADLPEGNGPVAALYHIEKMYNEIEGTAFRFFRAGYFFRNFLNNVPLIRTMGIMGANFPATTRMPLTHQDDIAAAVATELQTSFNGKQVRYIVSDLRTPHEMAKSVGAAIGIPDLPWVEFTDEQSLQGMKQAGLPGELAGLLTEMGAGIRSGSLFRDFENNGSPVIGRIKLEDFAKEFAEMFKQTVPVG
jgi:uncharacterized protein YbjT (DUF2867 family)